MFLPKRSRRKLKRLQRSPKIFVPIPSDRQLVVPFKPLSLFLIIFFFSTTVFFLLRSDIFQVRALDFRFEGLAEGAPFGSQTSFPEEALVRQRISEEVLGRSTIFLDPGKVEEKLKREFLTVRALGMTKRFPDGLLIRVSARVPLAQVKTKEEKLFLVDEEGLLFREARDEKLPIIDLGEVFEGALGETVGGEEVRAYLETLNLVREKGLATSSITLKPEMIELKLKTGPTVLLSVEKTIAEQIELLAQILKRYKVAGRTPKHLDLRFSRPVVRF